MYVEGVVQQRAFLRHDGLCRRLVARAFPDDFTYDDRSGIMQSVYRVYPVLIETGQQVSITSLALWLGFPSSYSSLFDPHGYQYDHRMQLEQYTEEDEDCGDEHDYLVGKVSIADVIVAIDQAMIDCEATGR